MNVLILMAGVSKDFEQQGLSYPRYLLEFHNKSIIQNIIESLEQIEGKIICIIRKEDQQKYYLADTIKILAPQAEVLEILGDTKGAVCTALFAIDTINTDEELLILNGYTNE